MEDKASILLVSISFPPKSDPECLQSGKYFKYLSRLREMDVITSSSPTLFMPKDETLRHYAENVRQLLEFPIPENKYLNYFWRKSGLKDIDLPDSKSSFQNHSAEAIRRLEKVPALIYSRSFPLSSALMAEKLVDHFQVPWVIHFSDPWSISPVHRFTERQKEYIAKTEKRLFQKASAICLTSEQALQAYADKYPEWKEKFQFFPNVYDPSTTATKSKKTGDKLKITYTGGLASGRKIEPVLDVLESLAKENEFKGCFELHLAGAFDRENRRRIQTSTLKQLINHSLLPYDKARELQGESDLLLLIDTPVADPAQAMFFPSKLLDYLQSGKKVIALTYRGSPVDQVMKDEYGKCCYYEESGSIESAFRFILKRFATGGRSYFEEAAEPDEKYSADYQARRLDQLFESLIAQKQKASKSPEIG